MLFVIAALCLIIFLCALTLLAFAGRWLLDRIVPDSPLTLMPEPPAPAVEPDPALVAMLEAMEAARARPSRPDLGQGQGQAGQARPEKRKTGP